MFVLQMAEMNFQINNRFEYLKKQCEEYRGKADHVDFKINVSPEEIEEEKRKTQHVFSEGYLESICAYRQICTEILSKDAFLMHAAVVEVDEEAYAFCAKSGTGKTTHVRLWKRMLGDRLIFINGDKPILRVSDHDVFAYGTPWAGKENYQTNKKSRLKAICFIERAAQNTIERLSPQQAVLRIMHQVLIPQDSCKAAMQLDLLDRVLKQVPAYLLKCNMQLQAAELSFSTMKGE